MQYISGHYWLLLLIGCVWAQSSPGVKTDEAAIDRAKAFFVSSVDRSLPRISFEYFLEYESEGAPIHWEVSDCERSGDAARNRGSDFPLGVKADFDVQHRAVSVVIGIGPVDASFPAVPRISSISITDVDGTTRSIRQLSRLPVEL